ncbi:ABC transporter ATP-binding protein [Dehalococcoidales bacterium]|nr:ABC transporter ATP-binding protein [Dehalococcoidales bacterium]
METVIVVEDLVKSYGSLTAVDGISFKVYKNEIFGIVGPNGAGKTTTVECLEGLRIPSGGSIRVLGLDPKTDGYKLRQLIGIQLQEGKFPDRIKVRETLELFASLYPRSVSIRPLLEKVGLQDKDDSYFDNLSGGAETAALDCSGSGQRPADSFLRRADDGTRSPGPKGDVGDGQQYPRRRQDGYLGHSLHGGSRAAL